MNANLLTDVVKLLKENGRTLSDIKQVRGSSFAINVDDFIRLAADCEYSKYVPHNQWSKKVKVAVDLTIIGDGWWVGISRYNTDGYGHEIVLDYYGMPALLTEFKKVNKLSGLSDYNPLLQDFVVSQ